MQKYVGKEIKCLNIKIKHYIDNLNSNNDFNLSKIQLYILSFLLRNQDKEIFQKDIEKEFGIRRSTITTVLQNMEKSDLLIRTGVESDKRVKKLTLTKKALEFEKHFKEQISLTEKKLTQDNFYHHTKVVLLLKAYLN